MSRSTDRIIAFDRGRLSLTNLFSETSENIAMSILLKTRFWLHFYCRLYWSIFDHFYVIVSSPNCRIR